MRKVVFSIVLALIFLTFIISCVNDSNHSNLNIHEGNSISDNKEDTLNSNKKETTDNNNEEDLDSDKENISINTTEDFESKTFLSNIPYDKTIEYKTNINGNLTNRSYAVEDDDFIYYVNIKDEYKLYKINKSGNGNQLIYGEEVRGLQYFDEKLYFLKFEEREKYNFDFKIYSAYICSIDRNGNNYVEIISDKEIKNFLILKDKIYYIALSEKEDDMILGIYNLFCYDISENGKNTIYENVYVEGSPSFCYPIIYSGDSIYFMASHNKFVEYNIQTNSVKTVLSTEADYIHINNVIVYGNKIIYKSKNDKDENVGWDLYIVDVTEPEAEPLCLFPESNYPCMMMSYNITDNYVFLSYTKYDKTVPEKSDIVIIRMKHDGSEAVKIKELFCREIYHLPVGEILLINDKLIFFNSHYWEDETNEMIKIMDFDGNELDWDI